MLEQYIFSGSLPENASTYVTRAADKELYEGLNAGKFCYVLNSRQSGKSSLRVRTMQRLRDEDVACLSIDLSSDSVQDATPEQWYVGLIDYFIESFDLDIELKEWWNKYELLSPLSRFRKFIEEVLLVEVQENIIVFIDEIDSVLSFKFPTDDFFAFIRACHNQRVDNPEYNRLTFCLLGVASPSNLISDKNRTPFNIGQAIILKGFQLHEVEPLEKGLRPYFEDTRAVIQEILHWTGGQPFLTQKLCQLLVEESKTANPRTIEQIVKAKIIDNWESQDFPEHLRTIRNRILRNEERAGYLLELYQQVRASGEITNNDSIEQSELMLSGLVVKQDNKLRVLNPIYYQVFNQNWIDTELKKLRPYSEVFRAWVASGCSDESRLLRGKALEDAEIWASDRNISYQDRQFLAASKEKEIQEEIEKKETIAQIERERKDREATEERNKVLSQANKKARQRISVGTVVLTLAVSLAGISSILAFNRVGKANQELARAETKTKDAKQQLENAQEELNKARTEATSQKQEVSNAKKQIQSLEKNTIQIKDEKLKVENQKKALDKQLRKSTDNLTFVNNEKLKIEKAAADLQSKVNLQTQELKNSVNQIFSLNQAKVRLNTNLKQSQGELDKKRNELEKTIASLKDLKNQTKESREYLDTVKELVKLAGELEKEGSNTEAKELLSQAGQSVNIQDKDHKLRQQLLYTGIAYANLRLLENYIDINKDENSKQAKEYFKEAQKYLNNIEPTQNNSPEALQINLLKLRTQGLLAKKDNNNTKATEFYQQAFDILNKLKNDSEISPPFNTNIQPNLLSRENIEAFHREYLSLLSDNTRTQVFESLKRHFFDDLQNLLTNRKWREADDRTWRLLLYSVEKENVGFDLESINKLSCSDLREIDEKWQNASDRRFGFRVQKDIYLKTGNKPIRNEEEFTKFNNEENYRHFGTEVGWYDPKNETRERWLSYDQLRWSKDISNTPVGHLPARLWSQFDRYDFVMRGDAVSSFALRLVNCNI